MAQNNNQNQQIAVIEQPRMKMPANVIEEYGLTEDSWRAVIDAVFPLAKSIGAVVMALAYAKRRNVDIFARSIHIVPMRVGNKNVETVWPGIGLQRITGHRQADFFGFDECVFGPDVKTKFSGNRQKWDNGQRAGYEKIEKEITHPEWAQMTFYKMMHGQRVAAPGPKVWFNETFAELAANCPVPNDRWSRAPRQMIEKCFSADTEVLTDKGFQRFDSVTGRIMEVNEHGIEATDAIPFRQDWDGPMIVAQGQSLNFRVTPNHDMVTNRGKMEAGTLLAKSSTRANYRIPLTITGSREDASEYSDDILRLAGAFISDGTIRKGPGKIAIISVSRPRKVASLYRLALHANVTTRKAAGDIGVSSKGRVLRCLSDKTVFSYPWPLLEALVNRDKSIDPATMDKLSMRQAEILMNSLIEFDGTTARTARRFFSSKPRVIADFEVLAVKAGYSISRRFERISDISDVPNFNVAISKKTDVAVFAKSDKHQVVHQIEENEDGEVWCATVPSGVIVVRRGGLSMLCGNCAEAAALRRAWPDAFGDEATFEEVEGRLGHNNGPEMVDGEFVEVEEEKTPTRASVKAKKEPVAEADGAQQNATDGAAEAEHDEDGVIPHESDDWTPEQWAAWSADIISKVKCAVDMKRFQKVQKDASSHFDRAPEDIRQEIISAGKTKLAALEPQTKGNDDGESQ